MYENDISFKIIKTVSKGVENQQETGVKSKIKEYIQIEHNKFIIRFIRKIYIVVSNRNK